MRDTLRSSLEQTRYLAEHEAHEAVILLKTRKLFEELTDRKRELVRDKIELLVTHGIQAVFGPGYGFRIEQAVKRNNVTFSYRVLEAREGEVLDTPLRGYHGGGLVALVGFLLRVVMVLFTYPPRRRIIFLDETMAALDGDKRGPLGRLLQELGSKLDMQFVMVTHSPEYADDADVVYGVRPKGKNSVLERVK